MALSLSSTHIRAGVRPCGAQRQSVRPLPPPKAGLGDAIKDIGASFVKIFSKPETNREEWQTTGTTGFQGNISHHGAGKPFKDGFVNKAGVAAAAKADAEQENQASYLGGAVQNVVGHNFTGDETEPPAGAGAAGWKGDIHDRKTGDGRLQKSSATLRWLNDSVYLPGPGAAAAAGGAGPSCPGAGQLSYAGQTEAVAAPKAPRVLIKDSDDPQERALALQVEQRLRNAAASGQLKGGSGSYTRCILYDADHVILTKALAANPHDILKALNFGSLPYKPCGTRARDVFRVLFGCADWMGCPDGDACKQRLAHHGLQHELEVFKSAEKGWGVRCWHSILQGSLVAIMHGVIIREKDEKDYQARSGMSHYIFDLEPRDDFTDDGRQLNGDTHVERPVEFVLDTRDMGNVARFINHSCDPNLYVQPMCIGHTDTRMVAVGLFAYRNISGQEELTYDYGAPFFVNHQLTCRCKKHNCIHKGRQ